MNADRKARDIREGAPFVTADRPTTEPRPTTYTFEQVNWDNAEQETRIGVLQEMVAILLNRLDEAEAAQGAAPRAEGLPERIVVDQHGHYWRDFGDYWSMCPVSEENVDTEVVATYIRAVAAPRAEGLDPRRLFDEMWAERDVLDAGTEGFSPNRYRSAARRIVDRLSRPSDERDAESEEPR